MVVAWGLLLYTTWMDLALYEYPRRTVESALGAYAGIPLIGLLGAVRLGDFTMALGVEALVMVEVLFCTGFRPLRLGADANSGDFDLLYDVSRSDRRARIATGVVVALTLLTAVGLVIVPIITADGAAPSP
jgi:hypothetical protein